MDDRVISGNKLKNGNIRTTIAERGYIIEKLKSMGKY